MTSNVYEGYNCNNSSSILCQDISLDNTTKSFHYLHISSSLSRIHLFRQERKCKWLLESILTLKHYVIPFGVIQSFFLNVYLKNSHATDVCPFL